MGCDWVRLRSEARLRLRRPLPLWDSTAQSSRGRLWAATLFRHGHVLDQKLCFATHLVACCSPT